MFCEFVIFQNSGFTKSRFYKIVVLSNQGFAEFMIFPIMVFTRGNLALPNYPRDRHRRSQVSDFNF